MNPEAIKAILDKLQVQLLDIHTKYDHNKVGMLSVEWQLPDVEKLKETAVKDLLALQEQAYKKGWSDAMKQENPPMKNLTKEG